MNSSPGFNTSTDADDVIRITAEDAGSTHVDDLLKRHASLRGERGITRDRGRAWYYQNWFIFMIAGTLGAVAAYALLNPYFDEHFYVQGTVSRIDRSPDKPIHFYSQGNPVELPPDRYLEIQLGDQNVVLASTTRWRKPDGKYEEFNPLNLKKGQTLGAYVDPMLGDDEHHYVAEFIVPDGQPRFGSDVPLETRAKQQMVASILMFPLISAFVSLFIAAADGILCRLIRRVLLAGAVGVLIGFVGGFMAHILAELMYGPLTHFAMKHGGADSASGFSLQTAGRGLAWMAGGMAMGLGQGIALRSKRLVLYGFLGGLVGGLMGGMLFDPIDLIILGRDKPSSQMARWIGFGVIGATVGLMIGIVERLARDAWLRMVEGPLAGKEFLVFKDIMRMGSSPRSEIYLFNDKEVAAQHAVIRATGDIYEIENSCHENPVCLNGRPVKRSRLRHGDRISVGRTAFVFQRQRAE